MFIDIFLIALLVWAVCDGWRTGAIKALFNALGLLAGLLIAASLYWLIPDFLAVSGSRTNMVLSIIAFIILCLLLPIGLGFAANHLTRMLKGMRLGLANSLIGAVVSCAKFLLLISFVFNIMTYLGIMNDERTRNSRLYDAVLSVLPFDHTGAARRERPSAGNGGGKPDTTYIYFNRDAQKADSAKHTTKD